jgi:UDP-N-acetylglucosamine:LPS N-acetylglucosamine transferase
MICGRNETLAERLRAMPKRIPMHIEGFTTEIPHFMRLADFFIGKPGPGSVSEAIAMKLPVIIERNMWTLPQERYNADWVMEKGAGIVLPNFREIDEAVARMIAPSELAHFKAAVDRIENRAVFEIPEILERILRQ